MKFFEVEQKYRLENPARIRGVLKKIGAKRIARGVETNEFYDKNDFFKKQKVALRLRRFGAGPAVLTLKGPRLRSGFTKRMEMETPIEYAATKEILRFLGCRSIGQYSKKREIYKLGKTFVTVDFLKKFGWFLEIEGQSRAIKRIEMKLGLVRTDREERSYLQMLFSWKH
jgi:predicted adenylyl cyclase CyaB